MKANIHPSYQTVTITCSCGNALEVGSTSTENIQVEICSNCHPFFTGKAKLIDTARRIDKFETRRQKSLDLKKESLKREKPQKLEKKEEKEKN